MRRGVAILSLFFGLVPLFSRASVITNDNTVLVLFSSSYDTYPYHYYGDYLGSWVALGHPQFTNHWDSASTGGGNLEDANENRLEKLGLAHWANGQRAIGLIMADDNGGFTSNQVQINLTNTLSSPTNLFNGSIYTNEGGWCSTQSITWIGLGAIPHDSADGDSGEIARNNAVTNMFTLLGRPCVDMWNSLWTGGWSNDNNGAHLLGYYTGSHPYASGSLTMGINIAQALAGEDTNVSLATIDFNTGSVVSTNHCVISSISENGGSLTFTRHDDRLPMAFDVPDGTITNDCRNAFIAMPQLSNAFWFTIAVTNLPAGNYKVSIDGAQIVTLSSSALATGWNMFTDWNPNSAYWKQRVAVLALIRLKNGADPVTLYDHNAGEGGPSGFDLVNYASWAQQFWGEGIRGDALVAALKFITTNLNTIDGKIHDAAQQTNHVFTITPTDQTITFPSPGDQVYGVAPITLEATASSGLPVAYTITSGPATVAGDLLTITGPGWVAIQASQSGNSNWPAAAPVTQTIMVSQKTLTGSITANDKSYDGTDGATIATWTLMGVVGTDDVTLTGGTATFPDKTAGSALTVTATGLSLTGTDESKYLLASTGATTTANISPADLTVNGITAADKVYDGTPAAIVNTSGAVLAGIIGTDAVALSGTAVGTFADSGAGMAKVVTVSGLALAEADSGNYQLIQPVTTANITPASTINTIRSSSSPASPGSNVTFTATLSVVSPGGGIPTGWVIFKEGAAPLGTNALNGSAVATFDTGSLARGNHTVTGEYRGDANFFGSTNSFNEVIDAPPVTATATLQRYSSSGVKIRESTLLTNDSDPYGDTLDIVSITNVSAFGATITTNGEWICYQPAAGFTNSDAFSYAIADSLGLSAGASVSVIVGTDTNASQNLAPAGGSGHNLSSIAFYGIPQRVYTIQYTTNTAAPVWQTLGTATASHGGLIQYFDDPPDGSPPRFYRTTYP